MARYRDSRSPSPAGSQQSARKPAQQQPPPQRGGGGGRDDERRGGGGSGAGRDRRRRSRSPEDVRRHRTQTLFSYRDNSATAGERASPNADVFARHQQRRYRDRDRDGRDRDSFRGGGHGGGGRDRSVDRGRDNDGYRGGDRRGGGGGPGLNRDRRRPSRDRSADRARRDRSRDDRDRLRGRDDRDRDRDHRPRRDDGSRDRGGRARREGTADSHHGRGGGQRNAAAGANGARGGEPEKAKAAATAPQPSEAEVKAERLAKLEAWKKKMEEKTKKDKEATPGGTRKLLAEMDEKAGKSPLAGTEVGLQSSVGSPVTSNGTPGGASPAYAGKFDPKAIAKKAAPRSHEASKLGSLGNIRPPEKPATAVLKSSNVSALPQGRTNLSRFGFHKASGTGTDKVPQKRKLMLDEEETSMRKLSKLPTLPLNDAEETPYPAANEDENDESDGENFAANEEEAAAEARKAMERREERIKQQSLAQDTEDVAMAEDEPAASAAEEPVKEEPVEEVPKEPVKEPTPPPPETMEVDDDVDPLDAYMSELVDTEAKVNKQATSKTTTGAKQDPEPEAYFSGDDYDYAENSAEADFTIALKVRKKKDIPSVDYSKLDLQPVRKNFWHSPDELKDMTEEETAELRLELDGIKVQGKNVPPPVQKWSQCGLPRQSMDVIDALGFEKPTPIQMQALPCIMSGRDVIGVAKTGSGKTLAFLLPMFRHIKDQPPLKDTDGPIGLIMAPTRELATQIHKDCKPFVKALGLRAVCAYGGAPIRDHIADLKRGAEIIVCTPGRMIDLLAANQGRVTNLRRVTFVVLDEADRMFDMGFEPQVMKVFNNMRPDRQTILFSATMPKVIDALTKRVLKSPLEITVGGKSVVAPEITQIVEVREEKDKFLRVLELLGNLYNEDEDARTLIFVERQEKADDLLKELMQKGYPCMSLHGGKDQVDRDSTISDFKNGVVPIVIATSVAARGLDIKQLKLVINYDAPNHLEDYVHRAGRTGRAGNKGTAVTFVTPDQDNSAAAIARALEQSGQPVPPGIDAMRKAHREKVKSGKAKDSSGFGGKGLEKLDKEREAARVRERKSHKTEGDDDDADADADKGGASGTTAGEERAAKMASAIQSAASAIVSRDASKPSAAGADGGPATASSTQAAAVSAKAAELLSMATAGADPTSNPLAKVSNAIDLINARLGRSGQPRAGQSLDNKGPDAGAFHATLEINDFPQKARWAVTNRTNVAKILDSTGTSITTKGTFYPAGKEVPAGADPKLYILVEGDTELVVANAMAELKRLLRDGTIAAADADSRAPVGGRYTVT